jgi:hypothetical protein
MRGYTGGAIQYNVPVRARQTAAEDAAKSQAQTEVENPYLAAYEADQKRRADEEAKQIAAGKLIRK